MTLDVTAAIQPKSDQLNADSLLTGPRTIKLRDVKVNPTAPEQPIWIYFEGDDNKPWKPCKTAVRCLAAIWGPDAKQWIGMSCTIYNDATVTWGGAAVGGIRVSHMEGLTQPRSLMVTKTRGKKAPIVIKPLEVKAKPETKPKEPEPEPALTEDEAQTIAMTVLAAIQGAVTIASLNEAWKANTEAISKLPKALVDQIKAAGAAKREELKNG